MRAIWRGAGTPAREQALLGLGALLILIHTIDDTLGLGEVDMAPTVITGIALAAAALYRVLPWFVVALVAVFVGVTRLLGGLLHVVSLPDPAAGDYTGPLEALGGLFALVVAVGVVRRRVAARRRPVEPAGAGHLRGPERQSH